MQYRKLIILLIILSCYSVLACDTDGDGFNSSNSTCLGLDCDDYNASINLNATEIIDNFADEDCDGWINLSSYAVKSSHPRMYVNMDNIAEMRNRAAGSNSDMYNWMITSSVRDGVEYAYDTENSAMSTTSLTAYALRAAFVYALGNISGYDYSGKHTPYEYGIRGKDRLLYWARYSSHGELNLPDAPTAYDQLYYLLNQSEREIIVDAIIDASESCISDTGKIYTRFGTKAPGLTRWTMAGLAFLGDGINDSKASEYSNDFWTYFVNGTMDAHNWMQGAWFPGPDYTTYETRLVWILEAWNTATTFDGYSEFNEWYTKFPKFLAYSTIPRTKDWVRWADVRFPGTGINDHGTANELQGVVLAAIRYRSNNKTDAETASISNWLIQNYLMNTYSATWFLIWDDPAAEQKSPSELNFSLSYVFNNTGYYYGRSSWSDDATYVSFTSSKYFFSNHDHADANSFVIYREEPLAITSGCYYNGDKSSHERNYHYRTIAENNILVYDPDETWYWFPNDASNDGGQKWFSSTPYDVEDLTNDSIWYTGKGISRQESVFPYYDYLRSDASKAYNQSKLNLYERELVYLRDSSIVIVFDRVNETSLNYIKNYPNSSKRWLLHAKNNFTITGDEQISNSDSSTYSNVNSVYTTSENSRLFLTTLLPENYQVKTVGKTQPRFEDLEGNDYPAEWTYDNEYGGHRIEVIPNGTDVKDYNTFLNILWPTDNSKTEMIEANLVNSSDSKMFGTLINNSWLIMFSKTPSTINQTGYSINATGEIKHLIVDLEPTTDYFIYDNSVLDMTLSTSNQGTLFFNTTAVGEHNYLIAIDMPYHEADTDEDGNISTTEIRTYVNLWKDGNAQLSTLANAITIWKGHL